MKKRILLFTLIAGISCLVFNSAAMAAGRNGRVSSSVGSIMGAFSICSGSATTLSDVTTPGTWASSVTSVATIGSASGVVTGFSPGTSTISYTTSSGTVTQVVTINPLPNAGTASGASGVCLGATTTLTDAISGGTWSSSATAVATVATTGKVTGVALGTSNITYTITNTCGTAHSIHVITVFSTPTIASITGTNVFCQPTSVTLSDTVTNGTWSSSNTAVAPVDSVGIVEGLSGGTALISYTVVYSCGTVRATYPVTVNPLPIEAPVSGFSALCLGTSGSLTDATAGDVWTSSNPAVATINASTGFVSTISAGTTVISYTGTNGCGSTSATSTVTVDTLPPSITIYGPSFVCQSGTITLTDSDATAACTWSSSNTAAATVASTGIVTGVAGGSTTISLIAHNSCGSDTATRVLLPVHPLPTTSPVYGQSKLCVADPVTLEDGISGGAWSTHSTAIATADPAHGVITGVAAGSTIVTYTLTNACGNSYMTYPVTVNPLPVPVISPVGNVFTCTKIYPSYEWEWDGTIIIGQTFRSYAATDTGHYTLIVTDTNGCTGSSTVYFYSDDAVTNVSPLAQSVQLYPNPAQSVLFIKAAGMVDAQFSTIEGRVLSNVKDAKQIDLSSFPAGIYYIVIYDSNSGAKLKAGKILKTDN